MRNLHEIGSQYLNQFSICIITPPMVSTANDRGTSFIFGYNGKTSMTADVVEAPDRSVLGQNQEDRICSDIVTVISPDFFKSITMSQAVPRLNGQCVSVRGLSNTCENMARVSKAKKFSLVYQELGREARRSIDWSLLNDDLLDVVGLSDSGDTFSMRWENSLMETMCRYESTSGSMTAESSSDLAKRLEVTDKAFRLIQYDLSTALGLNRRPGTKLLVFT